MPRKKRIVILCAIVVIAILIISAIISILIFSTDIFKSNKDLLVNYIMQNADNINKTVQKLDSNSILDEKKYTSTTNFKLNYTENVGTSSENTTNSINKYNCVMEGKIDKIANYNYQNIKILNGNNEEKIHLEYIQDNNTYGIKFSDLFNQYILVDNYNLKDVYQNIDGNNNQISYVPDSMPDLEYVKETIKFTEEEKSILEERYRNILKTQFKMGKVTKQTNQIIKVNEQDIKTTAYMLNLTREEINGIYLKLLEQIKQDDIILSKLDKINEILNSYNLIINSNKTINLRESFITKIEKTIDKINKNNIGQEEAKIIVYVKDKTTIRTQINYPDYELNLDFLGNQYAQLKSQKIDTLETKTLTLNCNDNGIELDVKDNKDGEIEGINILETMQTNENNIKDNIIIKYESGTNKVEAIVDKSINLVDELKELPEIKEEDKIKLNDLDRDITSKLIDKVKTSITEKIDTTFVNNEKEDFNTILKTVGIIKKTQIIETTGITEAEKSRYNSQFEILQGEKLTGENIITSLKAAQNNINGIEVVSNTELKVKLERNKKNEAVVKQLTDFIEENSQMEYNVKIEYDENGLAKYMVLNLVTE